ncbi:FecR family protein [Flavitalea sp.]|nr:FecR family protein [Flavitalea sp.]
MPYSIMNSNEEKRMWELAGKKIAGEATTTELNELNAMLEKFPEALYSLEIISHYWTSSEKKTEYTEREAALEKHMLRIQKEQLAAEVWQQSEDRATPVLKLRKPALYAIAASVLLVIAISAFWNLQSKSNQSPVATASNKTLAASKGAKNHFILPDGSKVWLNAGSTITYTGDFSKDSIREVFLSGEAFFEIRHDDHHPFLIHTAQMDIRDLGTSFNVKAYPNEKAEATLIEGSIEVEIKNEKQSTILTKPNEKIVVYSNTLESGKSDNNAGKADQNKSQRIFQVSTAIINPKDSLLVETAWMEDRLVFRAETFAELAIRMERWYDVTIEFENEEQKKYKLTGAFANETVEQALSELQLMKPFHFTLNNGKIIIKK